MASPGIIITGTTRLLGVMGWPIAHTRSPRMHAAAIQAAGLDLAYVPLAVRPEALADAVRGLRALGFLGCNVTIPHKVEVARLCDDLTPAARGIGAVNTLILGADGGRLTGANTDTDGAFEAVEEETGVGVAGRSVLILGGGGTAQAVAWGAGARGAREVLLVNRTLDKAQRLADDMGAQHPATRFVAVAPDHARERVGDVAVAFQLTSLGMKPGDAFPFDPAALPPGCVVLEAVYSPLETAFLLACRARGLRVVDGLAMLVAQGARSFEMWTGVRADRAAMKRVLMSG